MKKSEAAKFLTMLIGAYPNAKVTEESIVVYETMLSDLSSAEVADAVIEHIATQKWFPTVSELRDAALTARLGLETAEQVFRKIDGGCDLDCSVAKEALKVCGGRWAYKHSTVPGKWREDFRKTYNSLVGELKMKQTNSGLAALRGNVRGRLDA